MTAAQRAYAVLAGRENPVAPGAARDFLTHIAALAATKLADGLINPKLVMAWLLTALGAPAWALGLLVPIREAGALAPQLPLAPLVATAPLRKRLWALASVVQGLAALGIAVAALTLDGTAAALAILGFLAALSLARALGSLSHKDALARTVEKGARGAALGLAAMLGAIGAALFAAALTLGWIAPTVAMIAAAVALAGGLWLAAAALFLTLNEAPQAAARAGGFHGALLAALRDNVQLRRFITVRALLTGTALAPPFLVMLSGSLAALGPLLLASAAASVASGYVWGRLADRSSRRALAAAGALGAVVCAAAALAGALSGGLGGTIGAALAVFALQVAHEGVRGARKVHLTDMSGDGDRALNTALSNTAIGLVLLAGGAMGAVAAAFGAAAALAAFAAMCAGGAVLAAGLEEAQGLRR